MKPLTLEHSLSSWRSSRHNPNSSYGDGGGVRVGKTDLVRIHSTSGPPTNRATCDGTLDDRHRRLIASRKTTQLRTNATLNRLCRILGCIRSHPLFPKVLMGTCQNGLGLDVQVDHSISVPAHPDSPAENHYWQYSWISTTDHVHAIRLFCLCGSWLHSLCRSSNIWDLKLVCRLPQPSN